MHPIVFRIPLPKSDLPIAWLAYAVAAIAAAIAVWQFAVKKNRTGAITAAVIAAAAIVGRFALRSMLEGKETWAMSPIPIYSYGVMLGLSLVVGWYLTLGLADRDGLPKETMANCYVVTAVAAVIGSRVLYVLTNLDEFKNAAGDFELMSIFAMRRGGLVAYGGFLGGFVGSLLFLRKHKIPLLPWADVAVPSLASGLLITRIGCYLFGCDFGKPLCKVEAGECVAGTTWGPGFLQKLGTFPHWPEGTLDHGDGAPAWIQHVHQRGLSREAVASLPVHPTQLYESLVGLGLLALLLWARKHQKFRGQIFLLFTFAYGVCRFMLEILRDDLERGSIPPALPEHWLIPTGLALFAVAYAIGFSQLVKNVTVQRATQVLAFVPAVVVFFAMKPLSYGLSTAAQLSTSQAVALSTGFAACVAFSVLYKAALAHPESAMALGLPPPPEEPGKGDDDEDEEDEEDERQARDRAAGGRRRPKPARAGGAKEASKSEGSADEAPKKASKSESSADEAPKKSAEMQADARKKKKKAKPKPAEPEAETTATESEEQAPKSEPAEES